jgi:hypothetical protein
VSTVEAVLPRFRGNAAANLLCIEAEKIDDAIAGSISRQPTTGRYGQRSASDRLGIKEAQVMIEDEVGWMMERRSTRSKYIKEGRSRQRLKTIFLEGARRLGFFYN